MTDAGKFVFDSFQDKDTIENYFRALMDGINKGKIILSTDGEEIELHPNDLLRFSVKVKKKGGESSLSVKLSWKEKKKGAVTSEDSIRISS
jgi:amphi-Trp domain-containing protein